MSKIIGECYVVGCTESIGLCYPIVVVTHKDPPHPILIEHHLEGFCLCPTHQGNVRSPYEFFQNKEQRVRKMLKDLIRPEFRQKLDFENIALKWISPEERAMQKANETVQDPPHNPA